MPLNPFGKGQEASPIQRSQRAAGFKCLKASTFVERRVEMPTLSPAVAISSIPSHSDICCFVIVGALLFLAVAALGSLAEHLGPIPFGDFKLQYDLAISNEQRWLCF
jgi:hypothetical protein